MRRTSSKRLLEVLPLEGLVDATAAGRARAVFAASWLFCNIFSTQEQTSKVIWTHSKYTAASLSVTAMDTKKVASANGEQREGTSGTADAR